MNTIPTVSNKSRATTTAQHVALVLLASLTFGCSDEGAGDGDSKDNADTATADVAADAAVEDANSSDDSGAIDADAEGTGPIDAGPPPECTNQGDCDTAKGAAGLCRA